MSLSISHSLPRSWSQAKGYKWFFLSFFSGFLLTLSFAPFEQVSPIFAYLVFPLTALFFFQLRQANSLKSAYLHTGLFGLGLFLSGVSWVYVAIHEFGSTSWWLAGILTLIFVLTNASIFVIQGTVSYTLMNKFLKSKRINNSKAKNNESSLVDDSFIYLALFPLVWVFSEWLRVWILTGFPWLFIAYTQLSTPLSGFSPIIGVYGLSLISATIAGAIALLFTFKQGGLKKGGLKHLSLKPLSLQGKQRSKIIIILGITAIFTLGHFLQQISWTQVTGESIKVAAVQGNISQHNRWERGFIKNIKAKYYHLSESLWSTMDIIIWPENAIPIFYQYEENKFFKLIKQQITKYSNTFITGVPFLNKEFNQQKGEYYNSLLRMEENTDVFYFKQHLVPFGEYLPFEKWLRGLIKFFNIPMSGFSLPSKRQEIMTIKGIPVAVTLCYEDVYPSLILKQLPQAEYLINLSNNGWYGDSLAPHQHLQMSQMRALETGRDLIRSTTNGISALINYKGKILKQSKQFETEILTGSIRRRIGSTPYVKYGNSFLLIYVLLILVLLILTIKDSKKNSQ